jgi:hypothetical protein
MLSIQAYETASYACEPFKADTRWYYGDGEFHLLGFSLALFGNLAFIYECSMHGLLQVSHAKLECLFRLLIHSLNWW